MIAKTSSAVTFAVLAVATAWGQQPPSAEKDSQLAEQDFTMSLRALGPSGGKCPKDTPDKPSVCVPVNVSVIPFGASEDNRYDSFGIEYPVNNMGTALSAAMMSHSHAQGISVYRYSGSYGYEKIDLSRRSGLDLGVKQRLGRVGYGGKNGSGVYVEPFAAAGVVPFALGSGIQSDMQTMAGAGVKTMNSPAAYVGIGGAVNLWDFASVGVERRKFTNQGAGNQTKPFTNVVMTVTQRGLKAIGDLFARD